MIVGRRLATLRELQTFYSFEDALDMLEIVQLEDYYNQLAAKDLAHSLKRKR